jgi:hypothetical protein
MSQSVITILLAVDHNVGVSLAIAVCASERLELYQQFHVAFCDLFQIDLCQSQLTSDQRSALVSLGKRQKRHVFFLRPLLISLTQNLFPFQVGQLVTIQSLAEGRRLKEVDKMPFRTVTGEAECRPFVKTLAKAGLGCVGDELVLGDPRRWVSVSMMHWMKTRTPSPRNWVEPTNGDLNDETT